MRTIEGKVVVLGAQGNPYYRTVLYTCDSSVIKSYTLVLAYKFHRKSNFRASIMKINQNCVLSVQVINSIPYVNIMHNSVLKFSVQISKHNTNTVLLKHRLIENTLYNSRCWKN